MKKFFPTIEYVASMQKYEIISMGYVNKHTLAFYQHNTKTIIIRTGYTTAFRRYLILHELCHWLIDTVFSQHSKLHEYFDKHEHFEKCFKKRHINQ